MHPFIRRIVVTGLLLGFGLTICLGVSANAQTPRTNAIATRAEKLQKLLSKAVGPGAATAPRVVKTEQGHLRYLGMPPHGTLPLISGKKLTPPEAAVSFLRENQAIFTSRSNKLDFKSGKEQKLKDRSFMRMSQASIPTWPQEQKEHSKK